MSALVNSWLVFTSPTLFVSLVFASIVVIVFFMKKRTEALEKRLSQASADKEKEIAIAIVRTQEEERNKIALDLHDSVGAELSLLKLKLSKYSYYLKNNLIIKSESFFEDVKQLDETIENVRDVCKDLYPEIIRKKGLLCACRCFAERMSKGRNIRLKFFTDICENDFTLSDEAQRSVFRIFQEIMHNLIKHSVCSRLEIQLYMNHRTGFLKLRLRHNGRVFTNTDATRAIHEGKGHGLMNISNRLKVLGGKISYQRKGHCSFVFVSLPVNSVAKENKTISIEQRGVSIDPQLKMVYSKNSITTRRTRQPKLRQKLGSH